MGWRWLPTDFRPFPETSCSVDDVEVVLFVLVFAESVVLSVGIVVLVDVPAEATADDEAVAFAASFATKASVLVVKFLCTDLLLLI